MFDQTLNLGRQSNTIHITATATGRAIGPLPETVVCLCCDP
jgi:hypothetical protein